jgi:hypothetical protein
MACVFAEVSPFPATHPLLFANVRNLAEMANPLRGVRRLK